MKKISLSFAALLISSSAFATPISSDISIYGEASYDDATSLVINALDPAQTLLQANVDGAYTELSVYSDDVTDTVLTANLTALNDFIGATLSVNGGGGDETDVPVLAADVFVEMTNTSAVDSYLVTLNVLFINFVTAYLDGSTEATIDILDNAGDTLYASSLFVDTLYGNEVNGVATGDFGGIEQDSGDYQVSFLLTPNSSTTISASFVASTIAFTADSSVSFSTGGGFVLSSVERVANAVPEPTALALLAGGLLMLRLRRK